jgi:hypothetical protein
VFDLRYHVASLTAVFLALVIGILVGIGLSGRGFVSDAERTNFNNRLSALDEQLRDEELRSEELERRQDAAQEFVESAYPVLAAGRLRDVDVAVLVVGEYDSTVDAVRRAVQEDADGHVGRIRAVTVPLPAEEMLAALAADDELDEYADEDELDDLGGELAQEFVDGGETPIWDRLTTDLVGQRDGSFFGEADAVVVVREADPQQRETARFLAGLYRGLASAGVPAVGVEGTRVETPAIPVFSRYGLSTVDGLDTPLGKLALILLLGGSERGDFGIRETATDGILPTLEPLPSDMTGG